MAKNNNEDDDMSTDVSQPSQPPQQGLAELLQSLQQATSMAKQLSLSSTNDNNHRHIFASLTSAQRSLSSFISLHSSAATAAVDDEPMIAADDGDGEDEELNSMEEKMRELFNNVQCKRLKRPVSPTAAVAEERRRLEERENGRVLEVFDPIGTKLRNLDLIFQFHA